MEDIIRRGLGLLDKYKDMLNEYGINTPIRQAYFLATLATECKILPTQENMNYSPERLVVVFKKYFPTLETAKEYEKQPEKIGNRVYGNRLGNSAIEGYKFRGRGYIQLTGKTNYKALSNFTGVDFIQHPEWLLQENFALLSACWFWKGHKCNDYADVDNVQIVRKKVNGGLNGLNEFKTFLKLFKEKLNVD